MARVNNVSSPLPRQVFASALRRGIFTQGLAPGFVPCVQPFLDRLQFARFKQVQLFHVSPLNHGSSVYTAR